MRITFLCGSLEPGRDGVGDYTRRLAGELVRQGNGVTIIALHDKYLQTEVVEDIQNAGSEEISILRLSSTLPWNDRTKKASMFVRKSNPDWVSLQFVPFSFHNKGLPFGLPFVLNRICAGRKLHIMFHELWVGVDLSSAKKIIYWGKLQRFIIRMMLYKLKAQIVHTQCGFYQYLLDTINCKSGLLPLFGNIPVAPIRREKPSKQDSSYVSFVFFGGIHDATLMHDFAAEAFLYSLSNHVNIKFIFIGRNGALRDAWVDLLLARNFVVDVMGEQSVEVVSQVFQQSMYGITTTPVLLAEKSGSISAMIEHGLRVICIRNELKINYDYISTNRSVYQYVKGNFNEFMTSSNKVDQRLISIEHVTANFESSLHQSHITSEVMAK